MQGPSHPAVSPHGGPERDGGGVLDVGGPQLPHRELGLGEVPASSSGQPVGGRHLSGSIRMYPLLSTFDHCGQDGLAILSCSVVQLLKPPKNMLIPEVFNFTGSIIDYFRIRR